MDYWDDLLLTGGFAPRDFILRGLDIQQVGQRPHGVPHSIYQEVWHAAMVQKITLDESRAALERWPYEQHFPAPAAPASQRGWDELVSMFLSYSRRAVQLSGEQAWLDSPEPGLPASTWRDALGFLAVHTVYHLDKVVLLRQVMNTWRA